MAPQVFPFSMTAWQLTTGPERQFTCGPRVPWKERLRRVCEGTPPGFSFLLLFFPFFVRALILSPLSRVMGNVYVFSRIKATFSVFSGCIIFMFHFPFFYFDSKLGPINYFTHNFIIYSGNVEPIVLPVGSGPSVRSSHHGSLHCGVGLSGSGSSWRLGYAPLSVYCACPLAPLAALRQLLHG